MWDTAFHKQDDATSTQKLSHKALFDSSVTLESKPFHTNVLKNIYMGFLV